MGLRPGTREIFRRIALHNDKEAFTFFFNDYYGTLLQFAMLYVPHFEQAEDIVSNVMVRLIKKSHKLSEVNHIENFLFITVKNEALDYLKKEKRREYHSIDTTQDFLSPEYIDPYEKYIEKELRDLIVRTVEALPPKRKMVYKLIKDENMKYAEVSKLLDISERTVNVHMTLAVKELKQAVNTYLEGKSDNPRFMRVARALLPVFGL